MHNQRRMYVGDCVIVDRSPTSVDGYILAKYFLTTGEFRCELEPYNYYDVHSLFLAELNANTPGCLFNGYWGVTVYDYCEFLCEVF